ncbi:kinase-like protein [Auricularia subglabra TFB-10046 SS5]|nr:kinase-like protein [Auricularia subglabra TFB-10046 SS5]
MHPEKSPLSPAPAYEERAAATFQHPRCRSAAHAVANAWADFTAAARRGFGDLCRASTSFTADHSDSEKESAKRGTRRFEEEVPTVSAIKHIVWCLEHCEIRGYKSIVAPCWAANGTMSMYLEAHPRADRLQLLYEVASALAYLHTQPSPVTHGDVYIDNVTISAHGTAVLNDFSTSRRITVDMSETPWTSKDDYLAGRALYEAPEVHKGARHSAVTDVFAFGMLIFHAYAGKRPLVTATTECAVILAIANGERPAEEEITRYDFSSPLWKLVQACWHHSPAKRPTMPVVRDGLRNMLAERERLFASSPPIDEKASFRDDEKSGEFQNDSSLPIPDWPFTLLTGNECSDKTLSTAHVATPVLGVICGLYHKTGIP